MQEFTENPNWQKRPPGSGGVTWDGQCFSCGFTLTNKKFVPGKVAIEGNGRRIARTISVLKINGEVFESKNHKLQCSACCPDIMKNSDD